MRMRRHRPGTVPSLRLSRSAPTGLLELLRPWIRLVSAALVLSLRALGPAIAADADADSTCQAGGGGGGAGGGGVLSAAERQRLPKEETSIGRALPVRTECDEAALSQFLHDEPVRGMHLVCISEKRKESKEEGGDLHDVSSLSLRLFPGVHPGSPFSERAVILGGDGPPTWANLRKMLEHFLGLGQGGGPVQLQRRPWAIFTPRGERIVGAADDADGVDEEHILQSLVQSNMVLIMSGGYWVWPAVRIGFRRSVDLYSIMPGPAGTQYGETNRTVLIETLSVRPVVLSVKGFISDDECAYIRELAEPGMKHSDVVLMDKQKGRETSEWRTSQSAFVAAKVDEPILLDIERRTASLTRIPKNHQEKVQVLRYGLEERYVNHHDYFDPAAYKDSPEADRLYQGGRRNRLATVFWYLSDVARGGETIFPRFNGAPQPKDHHSCSKGLKVQPERGKVIIFYNLFADGSGDKLSLHGGCPVEEGIKWAANKWVWNAPMDFVSDA